MASSATTRRRSTTSSAICTSAASWCDGTTVLGVNFKESAREVRAFLEKLGVSFGTMLDMDGAVSGMYRVRGLPVTFLVDREGRLLWKAIGAREWDGPDGRAYLDTVLGGR